MLFQRANPISETENDALACGCDCGAASVEQEDLRAHLP
jgi:hypothetical protein